MQVYDLINYRSLTTIIHQCADVYLVFIMFKFHLTSETSVICLKSYVILQDQIVVFVLADNMFVRQIEQG